MEEAMNMAEEAGFDITEPSRIGDLSDVKDSRPVMPASSNVKLRIKKCSITTTKDESVDKLNVIWEVVDGIEVEGDIRFKGFSFFQGGSYTNDSIFTRIDYDIKESKWWQDRKRFLNLKNLLLAADLPVNDVTVNDALLEELTGKTILGTIVQYAKQEKDPDSGEYVNTGEFDNAVRYFKMIPVEDRV